ncbi:MAG: ATP-binding protein [Candidatus Paceibacterota bacterium]
MDETMEQWKRFVDALSPNAPLRSVILESWRRSHAAGVEPQAERVEFLRVSDDDLQCRLSNNADWLVLARPHLEWIATTLAHVPHVVYATDRDGIVLESLGDPSIIDTFRIIPGFDWSEKQMGTNGAGTAIAADKPVAVVGSEHFSTAFENGTCTGAPIHAPDGSVIGAIDISTSVADGSPEQLGLAAYAAYAIERDVANRQQSELPKNLLDLAPTIILVLDREGRIVRFNRFMETLCGYRLEEVKGKDWCDTFLTDQDGPHVREALQEIITGGTISGNTNPIITRSGEHRQISWRCTDFRDASGEIIGVLATGQDVTDLRAAESKAEQSQRLATIGQTVATFSHETRNELNTIKMALELLPSMLGDEEQLTQLIDHLKSSQEQLVRLLNDVQGFAAPMKLEKTNHGLSEVWQKAWESLSSSRKGRVTRLHEHVDAPTVQCYVDGLRLEQVFRNLFENSLAACSDPVEIDVTCSQIKQGGKEALRIIVRDNGPGLPPKQRAKIFQPFITTKHDGTGLGLALTKRIVEAHHGTIEVGQPDGRGAEFVLTIPITDVMEQQSSALDAEEV